MYRPLSTSREAGKWKACQLTIFFFDGYSYLSTSREAGNKYRVDCQLSLFGGIATYLPREGTVS